MTKEVSATIDGMTRYAQGVLQSNEHVGYQMSDALLKLQEHGLVVHGSPYEMQLTGVHPSGRAADADDSQDQRGRPAR